MTVFICQHCGAACAASSSDDAGAASGAAVAKPVFCKCGALAFCSPAHLHAHAASAAHTAEDCARMARQVSRREWLLPSPAALNISTKPAAALCRLLTALGTHNAPAWRYACPVHGSNQATPPDLGAWLSGAAAADARGAWDAAWSPAAADTGGAPAWRHLDGDEAAVQDWPSYYAAAGLARASPAALLLHHALTLWHCLARVLPAHGRPLPAGAHRDGGGGGDDRGSSSSGARPREIVVHYLGPRAGELAALPCFLAVALLLPRGARLRLEMAGPGVPAASHGRGAEWAGLPGGGGLRATLWRGRYDEVVQQWRAAASGGDTSGSNDTREAAAARLRPHLIFAPNAGLPAFASWAPTLACALALNSEDATASPPPPPFIATDYSEEAVHLSRAAVSAPNAPCAGAARGRRVLDPELNPFRCPLPATDHGTALPACSNALLFGWL